MPQAHRHTDSRFCGASTIVVNQETVYVNSLWWSVEGDLDTHCLEGALISIYEPRNIYIENIRAIVAVGDTAAADRQACFFLHPSGATNPKGHSPDVYVFAGGVGAGIAA